MKEEPRTLEPVTLSGWYERTDGSVVEYTWRAGRLCEDTVAVNWADVDRIKGERRRGPVE